MGRSPHGGVNAENVLSHKCGMAIRLRLFHARPVQKHNYLQRALILLIVAVSAYWAVAASPPNIIYILCDDLGYGDVRCLNPEGKIPTPNMDRLAAAGMIFTDAHSSSSVCTPTRYGILTGRYNWRSRMKQGVLNGFSPRLDRNRTA